MRVTRPISNFFTRTTIGRQFGVVVAVGMLSLAICLSLVSSWLGGRRDSDNLIRQGARVAENLAAQSKLALLSGSPENAASAMSVTLNFPDIVRIEIRDARGHALTSLDKTGASAPADDDLVRLTPELLQGGVVMEGESADAWRFLAPVLIGGEVSPFEAKEQKKQFLGYVRIVQSKDTLKRVIRDNFLVNILVSIAFAILFMPVIRLFTLRLTRSFTALSHTMALAKGGALDVRADVDGPNDIASMAETFNGMMASLQSHEGDLRQARDDALAFARLKAEFAAELASSNTDLERYAYVASHDLQTPLRNIVSYSQLLERRYLGKLGSEADEFIGFIVSSAKQMADMIHGLLNYTKITDETSPLERVSGRQAMDRALLNLKTLIDGSGAVVTVGPLPEVLADESQLATVFQHLIENAIKFRRPDVPPEVHVTAELVAPDMYKFVVVDNGIGISDEYFGKIFEVFQRLHSTADYRGSGVGLAICRRIVRRFGGDIGVTSTPGGGATFHFTVRNEEAV